MMSLKLSTFIVSLVGAALVGGFFTYFSLVAHVTATCNASSPLSQSDRTEEDRQFYEGGKVQNTHVDKTYSFDEDSLLHKK